MKEGKSPLNPVNELEYRNRIRIKARLIDYNIELQNIGLGQELIDIMKKNSTKVDDAEGKLRHMLGNFEKKPNGVEQELLMLFNKYDNLMKQCTNAQDKGVIGSLGIMEISRLLDGNNLSGGTLTIDGKIIKE